MRGAELKVLEKTAHRVQVTRGKDSARSTTSRSATCLVVAAVDSHLHRRDFIVDLESHRSTLILITFRGSRSAFSATVGQCIDYHSFKW